MELPFLQRYNSNLTGNNRTGNKHAGKKLKGLKGAGNNRTKTNICILVAEVISVQKKSLCQFRTMSGSFKIQPRVLTFARYLHNPVPVPLIRWE